MSSGALLGRQFVRDRVSVYPLGYSHQHPWLKLREVRSPFCITLQNAIGLIEVKECDRPHHAIINLIHLGVQITDVKIWIQRDGIEGGITEELVTAGVPKDKIVLAFHPPEVRHQYMGYGIA